MQRVIDLLLSLPWLNHFAPFALPLVVIAATWVTTLQHLSVPTPAMMTMLGIAYIYGVLGAYVTKELLNVVLDDRWALDPVKRAERLTPFERAVYLMIASPAIMIYMLLIMAILPIVLVLSRAQTEHQAWTRLGAWIKSKPVSQPGFRWFRPPVPRRDGTDSRGHAVV